MAVFGENYERLVRPANTNPLKGPAPRMHDPNPGTHFDIKGPGRFFNPRNVNGQQFNGPAVQHSLQNSIRAHTRAQYFRRAGFGAALRYTLGMEQVPSHLQDYLNARTNVRNQAGVHPGPVYAHYGRNPEAYNPSHQTYYSDIDSE